MKKIVMIIIPGLLIGLGNLFAQNSMQKDSSMNNRMNGDSMPAAKNSMRNDNMMSSKNNMNHGDSMTMNNGMHNDSLMATPNKMSQENMMTGDNKMMDNKMMDSKKMDNKMMDDRMTNSKMTDNKMTDSKSKMMNADVSNWPEAAAMAVEEITAKYGKPDGITADELFWLKKGVWKKICISKMESTHNFPIGHTDMMQTTISYNVPADKMDDLGKFDGSVTFDRTQGTMSARCDKEANNFLALNLAHDIITNKKTVAQARKAYGDIIKLKMKGGNPIYMAKLTFTPKSNTADPDKNTTGLTKDQVTKAITQNSKK